MRKPKLQQAQVRHAFSIKTVMPNGKVSISKSWAKVLRGAAAIPLALLEQHVNHAVCGSTSQCAMAQCVYDQKDLFPHPVVGFVEWYRTRVFIAAKLDEHNLPIECVVYEHSDGIAKLNDTAGGNAKLLKRIAKDGAIPVLLKPYRVRSVVGRPGRNRKSTGVRARHGVGAKLRYATMQLGAAP